jgi:hypothetical protein
VTHIAIADGGRTASRGDRAPRVGAEDMSWHTDRYDGPARTHIEREHVDAVRG